MTTMTKEATRATVLRILGEIAPEVDLTTIKPNVSLRDQIDMDSMDFLNFLIAVDEALHVDIPEADYPKLATLDGCVNYVAEHQRLA